MFVDQGVRTCTCSIFGPEYDKTVMQNGIFKARTQGVGCYTLEEAFEWGVTGPNLRACGLEWDFRKKRPYSGYENFEFDIPTATHGDSYDRGVVRVQEMRQSLRIIKQCLGVDLGQTTPDGNFTFLPIVCLGDCDHAPVLTIDNDHYHDLDEEKIDHILASYPKVA